MENKPAKALNLIQIFSVALTLYLRNIKRFLLLSFIAGFPLIIFDAYIMYSITPDTNPDANFYALAFVLEAVIIIMLRFNFVVTAHEAYQNLLKCTVSFDKVIGEAVRRIYLIFITGTLVFLLTLLLQIILHPFSYYISLPLVYLFNALFVLYPFVIAFEDMGAMEVLRRSVILIRGNFFKLLLLNLLTDIISPLSIWNLGILKLINFNTDIFTVVSFSVVETVMAPLQALILVIFYFDLRRQKENFNIKV